ncbi:hypothetical protein OG572_41665 [Streptomyces virginiae]|uniref:DUF4935 domain-containing protein n=1 Tax=Streptomyces virginiae TaxID=1961 RepID=A0ABZ1TQG5_STRVG
MSAIEYAVEHPEETVYFVSSNTKDFGDGTSYEDPMHFDVDGLGARFIHLTSLDQVLTRFTEPAEVGSGHVAEVLSQTDLAPIVRRRLHSADGGREFDGGFEVTAFRGSLGDGPCTGWAERWIGTPIATYQSLEDVQAHRIGHHLWCTATVRWLLSGVTVLGEGQFQVIAYASCSWDTRILLSISDEPRLVILRGQRPQMPGAEALESLASKPPSMTAVLDEMAEGENLATVTCLLGIQLTEREKDLAAVVGLVIHRGSGTVVTLRPQPTTP